MAGTPTVIEGNLTADKARLGLVVGRFNSFIVDRLEEGALDAFARHGGSLDRVTIVRVPGSFEIPGAARLLMASGKVDAVVCLGAVIRGSTPHFDYVSGEAAKGVGALAGSGDIPVVFGVLTCDTLEQAIDRAGAQHGNKGGEAVVTALEMIHVYKQLKRHG